MDDGDLAQLQLDVYMTREGPWNPEHGDIEIPNDWDFLPSGDAFVTRRVKAAGTFWVAWRPRGKNRPHRRRLGIWAPKTAIEDARAKAAATEAERARQRERGEKSRERHEVVYRDELADAIRRFLNFAPEHSELADEIASETATRAAAVGSGRVGRTRTLSLDERAALAARALIRHRYTSYEDDLFDALMEDPWDEELWYREVKADAQRAVDDFLDQHRKQEPGPPDDD
ncbi:MAG: DUF2293 domain-containing protein [Acidimicrobiia bacterium]